MLGIAYTNAYLIAQVLNACTLNDVPSFVMWSPILLIMMRLLCITYEKYNGAFEYTNGDVVIRFLGAMAYRKVPYFFMKIILMLNILTLILI